MRNLARRIWPHARRAAVSHQHFVDLGRFDAGAAQALIEAGAATAPVPGLARLISECWS